MNVYLPFVQEIEAKFRAGKALPLGGMEAHAPRDVAPAAPTILLFSPHPDDECITGLLPLRLMREAGMKVLNVPVTFGSLVDRQSGRGRELSDACHYLGWEIHGRSGFQNLEKEDIVEILKQHEPKILFVPHSKDWNSRHIATHFLVMDALAEMPDDFSCTVIETEFWGAMDDPNLMVEADAETLADLVAALSFHVEEVQRNPYHLSLPAWMQDNVRRGGELVGGQGGEVPDFAFATLYSMGTWRNGHLFQGVEKGRMVGMDENVQKLF